MVTKHFTQLVMAVALIAVSFSSCKKEQDAHVPPDMSFKTTAGYTSADATITQGDSILVGVIVTKTEDDLRTFNVSYSYDGGTSATNSNYTMTSAEYTGYNHDYTIHSRNQAGS